MTSSTLNQQIEDAIPVLLKLAKELTWNKISGNCKFIIGEIKNCEKSIIEQQKLLIKENNKKPPVTLTDIIPLLNGLYTNLYDINLYIYKAKKDFTIIDIRYYLKSSLDENYKAQVLENPPMLHCKISTPYWLTNKEEKFDINWEHHTARNKWKFFWLTQQMKCERIKHL